MKPTDIILKEVHVRFTTENLRGFRLSTGSIPHITYASVRVMAENRRGQVAEGRGGIFLSHLWAFPNPDLTADQKDTAMRHVVNEIGSFLPAIDDYADPLQIFKWYERQSSRLIQTVERQLGLRSHIPKLSEAVCWSPFDAAIHDGWARASGNSVYDMYAEPFLNEDLGSYLGEEWKRLYPNHFLGNRKTELPLQHVVGISDCLTRAEAGPEEIEQAGHAFPVSMEDWIRRDGVNCFKLKLKGTDNDWDLQRILNVDRVARATLTDTQAANSIQIALDPNTACPHPDVLVELLDKLKEKDERLYRSVAYIEQPTRRDLENYPYTLHELSRRKPVLLDESLDSLESLQYIDPLGWSGAAIKTCKGQSSALLGYCWAKRRNLYITVQDLTNPGLAYVHSANLAAHLTLSSEAFEGNSRQYAPDGCPDETMPYQEMFIAKNGKISLLPITGLGLY